MTLVEMLVAVLLLAVVVVPLGRAFSAGVDTAAASGARQDAAELANDVLAQLEATSYADLGFTPAALQAAVNADPSYAAASGSDSGTSYTWQGKDLVQLASGASSPSFDLGSNAVPFGPILSGVRQGLAAFAVTTHLAYGTGQVPACPGTTPAVTALEQAYVHVYVSLSWTATTANTLSLDTIIYPNSPGPYDGPSASSSLNPAPPTNLTATATSVTGEVKVSWTVPSSYEPGECFAVGWANAELQPGSTGMLPESALGTIIPGATVSYTVAGLSQGAEYVFYVTAYAPNGAESSESPDSPTVQSPTGPLVTAVTTSPGGPPGPSAYGPPAGGTTVTISGTGFSTQPGGTLVDFGTAAATSVSCSSTTTCTATAPAGTGTVDVTAATATGPGASEVTSPTLIGDQFTYEPYVLSVTSSSSGHSVTVSGLNFVVGQTSFTFGSPGSTTTGTCTGSAGQSSTSCTATVPPAPAGSSLPLTVDVVATTPGGSSPVDSTDEYTYQ